VLLLSPSRSNPAKETSIRKVERVGGSFIVGGERALFDRWRPELESALPRVVHVGRAGQAAGHGAEDLAVVVTALDSSLGI